MTQVFRDFSQPLEAISRRIYTVAGEPDWSSSLTSKSAVNINVFTHLSSSAFCHTIYLYYCLLSPS